MQVCHRVGEVVQWRKSNVDPRVQTIGFVPTMGCLHEGHLSLIKASKNENDFTVVSIFVNPSQFAPNEDLDKYPRTLPQDLELLEGAGVDMCFAPSPKDIYPQGIPLNVDEQRGPFVTILGVSEQLEGKTRPNFFRGVATVVTKLLNIVFPTTAYFGQKDIQQFIVLKVMTEQLFMNTTIKMMPIVRDEAGLALSSRNRYLCEESVKKASNIYRGLQTAAALLTEKSEVSRQELLTVIEQIWAPFVASGDFKVDYISIADSFALQEKRDVVSRSSDTIISCAVYVQDRRDPSTTVRLIDNVIISKR